MSLEIDFTIRKDKQSCSGVFKMVIIISINVETLNFLYKCIETCHLVELTTSFIVRIIFLDEYCVLRSQWQNSEIIERKDIRFNKRMQLDGVICDLWKGSLGSTQKKKSIFIATPKGNIIILFWTNWA